MKTVIVDYGRLDKRIHVHAGELDLYVDYDDVNHDEVDLLIPHLKDALEGMREPHPEDRLRLYRQRLEEAHREGDEFGVEFYEEQIEGLTS